MNNKYMRTIIGTLKSIIVGANNYSPDGYCRRKIFCPYMQKCSIKFYHLLIIELKAKDSLSILNFPSSIRKERKEDNRQKQCHFCTPVSLYET